uniref:NADH-ubiquinone oxidoreductase chain 2 n=1 Tax=Rhinotergum shaoguanense TaxID=1452699 RepID=A0A1S5XVX7_9ACAR|nr:NADH dehydrogenase subunit 2 [Rhinotergum shaoguanense]AQQ72858.1 NADH dehydrogenase subunit 2 [Rhinotergum shaoguanense]
MFFKLESFYFFLIYMFLITLFFSLNSLFMFWLLLEINLIIFVLFVSSMFDMNSYKTTEQGFYYLIIQALGSLILLYSILMSDSSKMFYLEESFLFMISLSLKIGLVPLHFWIFKLSNYLKDAPMFFILTFQKIPTLFILFSSNCAFLLELTLVNLLFGSLMLFYSKEIKNLMVSSSIYSTVWFFLFFLVSPLFFLIFLMNYFIFVFLMLKLNKAFFVSCYGSFEKLLLILSFLFFVGLPPMGLFFFKFFSLPLLLDILNEFSVFMVWIFTFVSTFAYFSFFYFWFFSNENLFFPSTTQYSFIFTFFLLMECFLLLI